MDDTLILDLTFQHDQLWKKRWKRLKFFLLHMEFGRKRKIDIVVECSFKSRERERERKRDELYFMVEQKLPSFWTLF